MIRPDLKSVYAFCSICMLLCGVGHAADWTQTFKEGVNNYTADGDIYLNTATIRNAPSNAKLPTYNYYQDGDPRFDSCIASQGRNAKPCRAGDYVASKPNDILEFSQCESLSDVDINPSWGVETDIPIGEYRNIKINQDNTKIVEFTSDSESAVYKIKSLRIENGTVKLAAGQYWIEDLFINSNVKLIFPDSGEVSFFIKNDYTHFNLALDVRSENFLIYNYGNFTLGGQASLNAYVMAEGDATISGSSHLVGAVTGRNVKLYGGASVVFDRSAQNINVVPDCGTTPLLPTVPLQCPAGESTISGVTYRTYDARIWKGGQYTSPVDHDDFNDLIANVKTPAQQLGESIESEIDDYGSGINPHSDQGDYYLGVFEGYIDVPESGIYTFGIDGDDAIELLIDDRVVAGFYGIHAQCGWPCETGQIGLAAGTHKVEMRFHEATGHEAYHLYWQLPSSTSLVKVPASAYFTCSSTQLGCFKDDFNRQDLGSDWAIKTLGSSVPPAINSQRMRITEASGNQATSSTFQRLFPAENNLVQVEFDYFAWSPSSGTGGDGVAIILSDAAITPQPGSFGGSLGYAQRDDGTPGFAGGWIGIGLDEYGNFSNPNEGKQGGLGFRPQAVAIRGSNHSGYMYLAGTRANISPTIDVRGTNSAKPNHRYRITVDSRQAGKALVLVERDIKDGNGFQVLIPQFDARNINGQGGVPADFYLSITGSTGGANNNHEIDNFEVCALDSRPVGQQVHHFEFDYSSNPLTCNPESMTIRACRNANCDLFTDPVTATLLPANMSNGGWVGGNIVTINNGIGTVSLRSNTTDPVTIGVSSSSPSTIAGSNTLCRKGNGDLDTASCTLSFAESGFVFDVPDELSNKPSTNILVKAVKRDDESLQCVPAFKGDKTVNFWSDYITPNRGTLPVKVTTGAIERPVGASENTAEPLTLSFDDKGQAIIDVNYADAGEMQLNARYIGSGDEQGLVMNGSNKFVRRPVGLCIDSEVCSNCSVSGPVYKKAGEEFDMTVKAMAWESDSDGDICRGNALTPNFTLTGIALTHELVLPTIADGGVKGALGLDEYEQKSGKQTVTQSVSEVGVFQFSATPKPNSYFGYSIPGATTGKMGRFTPYYLTVTPNEPKLAPSCNSFTYMDQPFGFVVASEPKLLVTGKNKQNNETKNYQLEGWWKYNNQWTQRAFSHLNGSTLAELVRVDAGEVKFLASSNNQPRSAYLLNETLKYKRTPTALAPFDALMELQLSVDDLKDSDGICYQVDEALSCSGITFENIALNDSFKLRYGRLVVENGYGPESESLRLPLRAEYVSSVALTGEATWLPNSLDNCSIYNTQTSADASEVSTTGLYMQPPTGFPAIRAYSDSSLTLQSGSLSLGNGYSYFSIPNATGEVVLKQHVEPWLKWYWNFDGASPTVLYDPRANAYFGTYRGHDKVIFWREVR
ncbi:DUF6701 domain-containing protein [Shewanella psychrotolerans]|uniref:DUF6701 domain-containing protein n=1 Tax=Shewanella psychrotolerans TaxID=2864206 RepID=UPI001C6557A3|nr:DUF6701 domain-containing protein [Shewanella psychrotolerans]QYK01800.1 MSHA biogenesis protein MshQ [Shewanella psychrotolerans]